MQVDPGTCELHQEYAYETYVDDIACNTGDRDPVPHLHPEAPNKEKVGRYRKDDGLQGHGDTRGDKAGEGSQGAEVADEAHHDGENHDNRRCESADEKQLPPSPGIMDVLEGRTAPSLRDQDQDDEGHAESQRPEEEYPHDFVRLSGKEAFHSTKLLRLRSSATPSA